MKKFGYVIAALATIAVAAPSIASAETIVVRHGDMHRHWHHGWDHGWHHGWRHAHDRVVIRHRDY
jgi:Spy/CpxP family protein refolding chaperone